MFTENRIFSLLHMGFFLAYWALACVIADIDSAKVAHPETWDRDKWLAVAIIVIFSLFHARTAFILLKCKNR